MWKTSRGIALLAIAALAVGIGSTTAIYTVIQSVLLNPLPYPGPDRYYLVFGARPDLSQSRMSNSYFEMRYIADRARTTETFGCVYIDSFNVTFNGLASRVEGAHVSPDLVAALGTAPRLGRWFRNSASEQNGGHVAVISDALWHRLGSDPEIIGKPLTISAQFLTGGVYTITGVMPPTFRFPAWGSDPADIWVPPDPGDTERRDASHYLVCIAKRRADVGYRQMVDDFKDIYARLAREYPSPGGANTAQVDPMLEQMVADIRPILFLLLVAAGVLLLVSCANVGSLLLARSVARARETALRVSLGAGLRQLACEYFVEGLFVAVPAAAAGALLSRWLVQAVLRLAANGIPRASQVAIDGRVLLVALLVAILSTVLFSLAPLWQARRIAPREVLSDGARTSAGARSRRVFRLFVVSEIAMACGLLVLGGIVVEQLQHLYRVRPGFDPDQLLTLNMVAPQSKAKDEKTLAEYESRLLEAVRSIPGVESAGFTLTLPLTGSLNGTSLWIDGRPETEIGRGGNMSLMFISPDYFRAMRTPLLDGRFFSDGDVRQDISAMILDQTAARLLFPQGRAVGSIVRSSSFHEENVRFRIVGIVGDVRNAELGRDTIPEAYICYRTLPFPNMAWAIRSPLDLAVLTGELRNAVSLVDSEQAIFAERPMTEVIVRSVATQRLQSFMVSFFAVSALLLAILGVYGVVAYSMRQRTVEIGTRMALGATSKDVIALVLGDGTKMAATGVAAGLLLVLALLRIFDAKQFAIQSPTPVPFLIATAAIAILAVLACIVPAWRASLLSPLVAIRDDPDSVWSSARKSYRLLVSRISHLNVTETAGEADLLAAAVDSSGQASSFSDAIHHTLCALEEIANAESAALLVQDEPGQPMRCIAASESFGKNWVLPADLPIFGRLRHYSSALPLSDDDLETWSRWAQSEAPTHLPGIETLRRMRAALAAPITVKSKVIGVLLLGNPTNRKQYSAAERRALRSAGSQFALLIENGRLAGRVIEHERLRRELQVATEVQKRLFPDEFPETAAIQCAGLCLPARGVGGDYFDFLQLDNQQIGIALADVAGKGIAAALIMSVVQASLRSLAETNAGSLADLAARMNRLVHRSTGTNSYATFFYGQLDEEKMQLRYINAGHNPPLLWRSGDGSIEELAAGGTVIGIFAQSSYEESNVQLKSGDVLIAFTDGVSEAHNPREEEFGEERLRQALRRFAHLPVSEITSKILEELKLWMADAEQFDDLTFLVVKVR